MFALDDCTVAPKLGGFHVLRIRLPQGGYTHTVTEADETVMARLPWAKRRQRHCVASIKISDGESVVVYGFGLPYSNEADPSLSGIINGNKPIVDGITLTHLLAAREFILVVGCSATSATTQLNGTLLPPPFTYPDGTSHAWDLVIYDKLLAETKAPTKFNMAIRFDDVNSMLAVNTQTVVQGILWLHHDAERLTKNHQFAYMVPDQNRDLQAFVMIPLSRESGDRYATAWRWFTKSESIKSRSPWAATFPVVLRGVY